MEKNVSIAFFVFLNNIFGFGYIPSCEWGSHKTALCYLKTTLIDLMRALWLNAKIFNINDLRLLLRFGQNHDCIFCRCALTFQTFHWLAWQEVSSLKVKILNFERVERLCHRSNLKKLKEMIHLDWPTRCLHHLGKMGVFKMQKNCNGCVQGIQILINEKERKKVVNISYS